MKKVLIIITAIISIISCTNLDEVWNELRDHEERIQKLEALCNKLNSNIEAMQAVLTALEQNDYVTDVVKVVENGIEVGYSITFAKGGTVTIYHGTDGTDGSDGKDGAAPKISIKKAQDGEYYWTIDGQWLTDENGNKVYNGNSIAIFTKVTKFTVGGIVDIAKVISGYGFIPAIVGGIILSGILASTMSTADSQLLAAASSISQDLLQTSFKIKLSAKKSMLFARLAVKISPFGQFRA